MVNDDRWRIESAVRGAGEHGQDRVAVVPLGAGHLLVLSDGAGGTGGGREAAEAIVRFFRRRAAEFLSLDDSYGWILALAEADRVLEQDPEVGEATAIVAFVARGRIWGASVGDSRAWIVGDLGIEELTEHQRPKPLIGSGGAVPVGFGPAEITGRALLGSDGLFDHGPREEIAAIAREAPIGEVVSRLIDRVRLPDGELMDDVAVIVCERSGR